MISNMASNYNKIRIKKGLPQPVCLLQQSLVHSSIHAFVFLYSFAAIKTVAALHRAAQTSTDHNGTALR